MLPQRRMGAITSARGCVWPLCAGVCVPVLGRSGIGGRVNTEA